jgi:Domain of unknown function (DUF397)
MNSADLLHARWTKSSYSDANDCVEVAFLPDDHVAVRDSKDRGTGPALVFTAAEWNAFTRGVVGGEFRP